MFPTQILVYVCKYVCKTAAKNREQCHPPVRSPMGKQFSVYISLATPVCSEIAPKGVFSFTWINARIHSATPRLVTWPELTNKSVGFDHVTSRRLAHDQWKDTFTHFHAYVTTPQHGKANLMVKTRAENIDHWCWRSAICSYSHVIFVCCPVGSARIFTRFSRDIKVPNNAKIWICSGYWATSRIFWQYLCFFSRYGRRGVVPASINVILYRKVSEFNAV